ncbi:MAG: F0F1 ATP synthase subunit B, partial [Acidaminococcaceae bacterium]|nr:F0F1 ATP synthase subunit B [Acidaminococcaceae bacterium]
MVNIDMTLIAQAVNFLFLLWFLNKFAYKPVLKMMEDRKAKIAGDLGTAEAAKNDAEAAKAEAVDALAQARIEAQAIIDNARK